MCSTYSARTDIHNAGLYGLDPSIYLNISDMVLTRMAMVAAMVRPLCYQRMNQFLLLSNALPPLCLSSVPSFSSNNSRPGNPDAAWKNVTLVLPHSQSRYTIETPSAFT
jgi:hypothetical protein